MTENKKRRRSESPTASPSTAKKLKPVQLSHFWSSPKKKTSEPASSAPDKPAVALGDLLDLSALQTEEEIQTRFEQIAEELLLHHLIALRGKKGTTEYDILEVEFYLHHPQLHPDPYTHQSFEQRISGRWYFHRPPSKSLAGGTTTASGYRGGSRKGLDITIGGATQSMKEPSVNIRGGILLRTIRRRSDQFVISGPSKLVDEILAKSAVTGIEYLVDDCWLRDTSIFAADNDTRTSLLTVERITDHSSSAKPPIIHHSPRIGLDLSNSEATSSPTNPRVIYVQRPYRIFTHPQLLIANGRSQTFLGLYHELLLANPKGTSKNILSKVADLSGIKASTVSTYAEYFDAGVDSKDIDRFIGAKGKGASASPALYLNMMGVLWSMREVPS